MAVKEERSEEEYFPIDHCERLFSELSLWTSVQDCLAAARCLEKRPTRDDVFSPKLIVPFLDSDLFQAVLSKCIGWLIPTYRVPEAKIRISALQAPEIKESTLQTLRDLRWRANISMGAAGTITQIAPGLSQFSDKRFFVVEDEPHVIEVIQNPIRCILDLISRFWPTASKMRKLIDETKDGSEGPVIFHQPYTDGSMAALVEALVFYAHRLELGPRYSEVANNAINRGYRSVEVVGHPPIDAKFIEIGQESAERMFESIA
ncbi:hypothetical protein [Acidicapsa acidisoli]|uniref:hypothetical protein n=1 Tax=Acidicapsa acidisoli TaxID=1615681 RepID=UPI0021DF4A2B|nr:hypothetical protein [Acidicapsa acidisoli]